jgi:thiol-disulfide isomerase/thioredoxin
MLDFEPDASNTSDAANNVRVASLDVITGRVVDASGRPQVNVTVVGTATGRTNSQRKQAVTDATGGFTLDGLRSGERYLILATATRSSVPLIGRVSATAPEQQVVIQVSRPFTARRTQPIQPDMARREQERTNEAGSVRERQARAAGDSVGDRREYSEPGHRELPWDMPPAPGSGQPLWIPADDQARDRNGSARTNIAADQFASRDIDAVHGATSHGRVDRPGRLPAGESDINPGEPLSWPDDTATDATLEDARRDAASRTTGDSKTAAPIVPDHAAPRTYQATTCQFDGNRLVDFRLPDLELREITFRELPGRLVLFDFWGSWCGYCLKTMPQLVELQRRYGAHGLQVVGIAYEQGRLSDRVERVREIREQLGVNYPLLVADGGAACPVREQFGVQLYPTLVLVDRTGRVLWRSEGSDPRELERLENLLKTQLADAAKSL